MKIYEGPNIFNGSIYGSGVFDVFLRDNFFNLPEWYGLISQCCIDAVNGTILIADEQAQIAIACCHARRNRYLRSCTNLYTPEFNLLGNCSDPLAVEAFSRDLASSFKPLDYVKLEGLDPQAPQFQALLQGLRDAGFFAKPFFGWITRFEGMAGIAFEQYFSTRPSVLRNTYRRKQAKLRGADPTLYTSYEGSEDVESFISTYEGVRERSWKMPEPLPEFVPTLVRLAARMGALRFGVLEINKTPAAAQFWIVWGSKATIFKLVHAEVFSAFSPGTLLTMHMIQRVLEVDRPVEIDFGRGDDTYKRMWLSSSRERWGIEAANPGTWRGLAMCARLQAGTVRHRLFP